MKALLLSILVATVVVAGGCKKDKDKEPAPKSGTPQYYFKADIASGGSVNYEYVDVHSTIYPAAEIQGSGTYVEFGAFMASLDANYDYVFKAGVSYGKLQSDFPTHLECYDFLPASSSTFGNNTSETVGYIISYVDADGTLWSSQLGTGNQTGSLVTITSKAAYDEYATVFPVEGTFNCKVYDGAGNSKTLTNGKFIMTFPYSED